MITEGLVPNCNTCHQSFPDFRELANHIISKRHRKGRVWAARYLLRQRQLDRKTSNQNDYRIPITEEQSLNKQGTYRQLSGYTKTADTFCPNCNRKSRYEFPVEFVESPIAWKINDRYVKLCVNCGGVI